MKKKAQHNAIPAKRRSTRVTTQSAAASLDVNAAASTTKTKKRTVAVKAVPSRTTRGRKSTAAAVAPTTSSPVEKSPVLTAASTRTSPDVSAKDAAASSSVAATTTALELIKEMIKESREKTTKETTIGAKNKPDVDIEAAAAAADNNCDGETNDVTSEQSTEQNVPKFALDSAAGQKDENSDAMTFQQLNEEMELVGYMKTRKGQQRRVPTREISKDRSIKRRALERQDRHGQMKRLHGSTVQKRFKRGSSAAYEDEFIQQSLVQFPSTAEKQKLAPDDGEEDEEKNDESTNVIGTAKLRGEDANKRKKPPTTTTAASTPPVSQKKRKYQQLRPNFQSVRLAALHGDALGAHAQGKSVLAIRKLKSVAKNAPFAPQIYSSLGLVYEDMLRAKQLQYKKLRQQNQSTDASAEASSFTQPSAKPSSTRRVSFSGIDANDDDNDDLVAAASSSQSELLSEQLVLAKKAYGSFHVAALLYKRDHSLWVRAGDAAIEIVSLHTLLMLDMSQSQSQKHEPSETKQLEGYNDLKDESNDAFIANAIENRNNNNDVHDPEAENSRNTAAIETHRREKSRWLMEAKNDYGSADNLGLPGIEIPAKLARVLIDLGLLSEAFTILTGLKDDAEFRNSFRCWELYGFLMLRIGHECKQWNKGIQTTSNYMFRRWLRKHSIVFDWRERRLQCLVLALATSAGTSHARRLVKWLKDRAPAAASGSNDETKISSAVDDGTDRDRERRSMIEEHLGRLYAFDSTTKEMNLKPDSIEEQSRADVRDVMIQHHDKEITSIVISSMLSSSKDDVSKTTDIVNTADIVPDTTDIVLGDIIGASASTNETNVVGSNKKSRKSSNIDDSIALNAASDDDDFSVPISASVKTVCRIASELLRHLLDMDDESYAAGELVVETVSMYLKARAVGSEKRREMARCPYEQPTDILGVGLNNYIDGEVPIKDDMDSDDLPLSDDDELDQGESDVVLQPLRQGAVPPELQFLYGLCLICKGDRAFLAGKCIAAVSALPVESDSWLTDRVVDTCVATDSIWMVCEATMKAPIYRTSAFALMANVIRRHGKEADLAPRVLSLFHIQNEIYHDIGWLDMVTDTISSRSSHQMISSHRKSLVILVFLTEIRIQISKVVAASAKSPSLGDGVANTTTSANIESIQSAISSLNNIVVAVWGVEREGQVSIINVEILECLASAYHWLLDILNKISTPKDRYEVANECLGPMIKSMSTLSRCDLSNVADDFGWKLEVLHTVPIKTETWLTPELKSISSMAFNMCTACNASMFSGWENDEFNMRLLRECDRFFFGLSAGDNCITGLLPPSIEEAMQRQWETLQKLVPGAGVLDFAARLSEIKESTWYQESRTRLENAKANERIAIHGETEGLSALVSFSGICLAAADNGEDTPPNERMIFTAVSVLLPLSQFCLRSTLSDSSVGAKAARQASGAEPAAWKMPTNSRRLAPSHRSGYVRRKKRAAIVNANPGEHKALMDWFTFEPSENPIANLIAIPVSELNRMWMTNTKKIPASATAGGVEAMQKVHACMMQLRICYTEQASSKCAIHVAMSLLDLASHPSCENPLLCMQQAVLFASQSPKAGASDRSFRVAIPSRVDCTAVAALKILGRADCLRAVNMCREAAFLCCFVAESCTLRRTTKDFDDRWKVVSVLTYDLSVNIRATAEILAEEIEPSDSSGTWEKCVVDELEICKGEGTLWKSFCSSNEEE